MGDRVEISEKENNNIEEREVMDTPERSKNCQIATPIAKFEESPVFNFLNSLSPIRPIKSVHISQSINPLSFASLGSVFTSPHVTSVRESRFLRRHQLSDPSKPEFSSDDQTTVDPKNENTANVTTHADGQKENIDPRDSECEPSYNCSKFVVDFPEDAQEMADYTCDSSVNAPFVVRDCQTNMEGVIHHVDQDKEGTSCDWDSLINASDLLIFESPVVNGSEQENVFTQPGDGTEITDNAGEKMDYEHLSGFYRGMRRRCLVFEMGGGRKKHMAGSSGSDSSALLQSDDNNTSSSDQKLLRTTKLPGIGLHLNALAATPKEYKLVNGQDSSTSRRLLIGPSSSVDFNSSNAGQELLSNGGLVNLSLEGEIDSVENAVVDEINPCSPKKKRRKVEQAGDGNSCKRCNCKKSKCLKLYCECFAAGVYCVEPCACIECFNKPIHEDMVLMTRKQIESRNPLAFAPKVIRGPDSIVETGEDLSKTPASARHKRGCNCKKSGCLKKYCECYQGGVGCSMNCRCEGCKNAFGIKDGSCAIGHEAEAEEDEIENDHETNMDPCGLPATPLRATRQSIEHPFSSKKNPPQSSFPSISSSSGFVDAFGNPNFLPPPPKFSKHFETVREDEMPEFLQEGSSSSPISGIKLSSPNRKRVSPPRSSSVETSIGGLRSSRKLILQSIPSFPSLTSNQ
ncbi:hypothetical protein CASFOL_005401 [Castilleja foliolosa]|uniref:CRC domain-containing protein n=1 Tax=Castilleja foliolosa TaxID=1961234 RepID=A0ABD3E3B3_9LAMI